MFLLKYYQLHARFPTTLDHISYDVQEFITAQLESIDGKFVYLKNEKSDRMFRRYFKEIRSFLGIRKFGSAGKTAFRKWVIESLFSTAPDGQQRNLKKVCLGV